MRITRWVPVSLMAGLLVTGLAVAQRAEAPGERWDEDEGVTLDGTVTKVNRPFATFEAGGDTYTIHLGPAWYWEKQGYSVAPGDRVTVTGQVSREGKARHLYLHSMVRGGETYTFAVDDGVPSWSRGGWRGGRRGGWHGQAWSGFQGRGCGHQGCCGGCPGHPACEECPGDCPRGCCR